MGFKYGAVCRNLDDITYTYEIKEDSLLKFAYKYIVAYFKYDIVDKM